MHWLTRWVGPLLVLVAGLAGPATAELRYTTIYKDHLVHGTTPGELYQDMIAHPIMDPDDGPAFANITHDHALANRLCQRTVVLRKGRALGAGTRLRVVR